MTRYRVEVTLESLEIYYVNADSPEEAEGLAMQGEGYSHTTDGFTADAAVREVGEDDE